jgi:hypothetical protein
MLWVDPKALLCMESGGSIDPTSVASTDELSPRGAILDGT